MAGNKKPRKKYRRMVIYTTSNPLPITMGITAEMKTELQLPPHLILEAFKNGAGTEEGAHTLAAAVNLGAVMARTQPQEVRDVMEAALHAMHAVMRRGQGNVWGMSGPEMTAIGEGLALANDMQDISTRRDLRNAIATVYREGAYA